MNSGVLPTIFFCLATGAALGCLFLLCKAVRLLLSAGKLCTALIDIAYCLFTAAALFLCALAVDRGRPRFFQFLLQGIGAWSAIAALDPFVAGAARGILFILRKLMAFFKRLWQPIGRHFGKKRAANGKKPEKSGKNRKKAQKKT